MSTNDWARASITATLKEIAAAHRRLGIGIERCDLEAFEIVCRIEARLASNCPMPPAGAEAPAE